MNEGKKSDLKNVTICEREENEIALLYKQLTQSIFTLITIKKKNMYNDKQ